MIGALFPELFPPAARFYWARYLKYTLPFARRLIAVSECTRRDLLRLTRVPADHIDVILNGLEPGLEPLVEPAARIRLRTRLRLPSQFFLYVGTLEPRKGIDTLIEAFAETAPRIKEDLVIAGKRGWSFQALFDQVLSAGLERKVHFLDYVDDRDLAGLYSLATAFVLPSRYEGFGLTVLEAMACGAPVIASNAGALPEVLGNAGIFVAPDDMHGLANALWQVSRDKAFADDLRARGLVRAKLFSWADAATRTAVVYARSLESAPKSRPAS
jgi:glycosyltransferase involved in cell wall biosynthesis